MNITASGSAKSGNGNARVNRISIRNNSFPGKSNRDKAYPAGAPTTIDMTMVSNATRIEFFSALSIPANPAKNVSDPRSNSGMKLLGKAFTASGELSVLISKK